MTNCTEQGRYDKLKMSNICLATTMLPSAKERLVLPIPKDLSTFTRSPGPTQDCCGPGISQCLDLSTLSASSAASDVYKRQAQNKAIYDKLKMSNICLAMTMLPSAKERLVLPTYKLH